MRDLLSRPGGEAMIEQRYGEAATDSEEFRAARRQQQRAAQRGREAREAAAKQAAEKAEQSRWVGQRGGDRSELQDKLDRANKDLDTNRAEIRSQAEKSKGQVQMQSM